MLDARRATVKNLAEKYINQEGPWYKAGMEIHKQVGVLKKRFEDENAESDLGDLVRPLNCAIAVLNNPQDAGLIHALKTNANSQAADKPSFWKKFIGALTGLAGIALLGLGLAGIFFTAGASLTATYIGGSLLTAGGAALFYHGTQGPFASALSSLATCKVLSAVPAKS